MAKNSNSNNETKIHCIKCGNSNQANFYVTRDNNRAFFGKIPYCKNCIKEIYNNYLVKYNNNENLALYYLCRKIDMPYIHSNYLGAKNSVNNPNSKIQGENALISSYMKGFGFAEQNNWGTTFDDSEGEGEIEGLSSYAEVTKVKKHIRKKPEESDEYEIIEYDTSELQAKWGAFDIDDLAYLESEYLDWDAKLGGINEKSIDVIVKQICLQCKDINKDRLVGANVDKKLKTLTELLKNSGLIEKQNTTNYDEISVGMSIKDIEHLRPIDTVKDEVKDVDNMLSIMYGLAGGISRSLCKENFYTEKFDEIYGKYGMDIINNIKNEDDEDTSNIGEMGDNNEREDLS